MVVDILVEFLVDVALTIGSIALFGFLIAMCNRIFYNNFGRRYFMTACYATGFIGTPLHELSHALMCVIFGHHIDEIVFFEMHNPDSLGHVSHRHNPRNIYQNIGNFFIGVAPIIVMSALVFLLLWAFMPDLAGVIIEQAQNITFNEGAAGFFGPIGESLAEVGNYLATWQLWVFLVICLFICPHMTLSVNDIKNSLAGLIFVLLVILIIDICFGVFGALDVLHEGMMKVTNVFNMVMLLALIVTLVEVMLSYIIRFVFGTRRR